MPAASDSGRLRTQGKEFPVFFYGQHYALESVEAGAGALAFLLAGVGPLPLKLAMLALWTLGVMFVFLALSNVLSRASGFWITRELLKTLGFRFWD